MLKRSLYLESMSVAGALLVAAGCTSFGSDEHGPPSTGAPSDTDGGTPAVQGQPDRGLTVTVGNGKATAFVVQGRQLKLLVKLTRRASTTGAVTITLQGLPTGVTADPLVVLPGNVDGTLAIHATSASAQGPFSLDISALEAGSLGAGAQTKLSAFVRGAPGALDTTFGVNGLVRHLVGPQKSAVATDLVVMGDDRLVAVADCPANACVTRASADGVPDKTYGTGGLAGLVMVMTTFQLPPKRQPTLGQAVADGSGVVLSGNGGALLLALGRLTETGQPDANFGTGTGPAVGTELIGATPNGGIPEGGRPALARRQDGSLLIGFNWVHGSPSVTLGLLMRDKKGAQLASFGTNGTANGPLLVADNAPVVGFRANGSIWTARVDPRQGFPVGLTGQHNGISGAVDALANTSNYVGTSCEPNGSIAIGGALALADGAIVAAFHCGTHVSILRSGPDGTKFDLAWGTGGVATIEEDARPSVSVDNSGRILVALLREGGLRLMRLGAGGAPDPTFGDAGTVVHAFGTNHQIARAFVQKDGRIVVLGTEDFADGSDVTLSRYWD